MTKKTRISLVAIPDASLSTLHGLYDVLNGMAFLKGLDPSIPESAPEPLPPREWW